MARLKLTAVTTLIALLLALVAVSAIPCLSSVALAQGAEMAGSGFAGDPQCPVAWVNSLQSATLTLAGESQQVGELFSDSGHFEEHPVEEPCDPGKTLGPFIVTQAGALKAHVVGTPPAPAQWSLSNFNTSLRIVYEPSIGRGFGAGRAILELSGQMEDNDLSGTATWEGPGRIWAYIGPPAGHAPLNSSCFEQSYVASAEITEFYPTSAVQPGAAVLPGDEISNIYGPMTLTLPDSGASVMLDSNTTITLNSDQEAFTGTERVSLWYRPAGVLVQETGAVAAESVDLGYPEWLMDLQDQATRLSRDDYIMPEGYSENPATFWLNYREDTLLEAYDRIKDLTDPAEAATEFRLFMNSKQGQWNMLNAGEKGVDVFADVAMIWLLPNGANALESFLRYILRPVPVLGLIANAKNAYDTYDRIAREVVYSAASQRAGRALETFDKSRGWSVELIEQRIGVREAEIAIHKAVIEAGNDKMIAAIKVLADNLISLGCGASMEMTKEETRACDRAEEELYAGRARAQAEYEALVRRRMEMILEAQTEISDLTNYRMPIAQGDVRSLKRMGSSVDPGKYPVVCVPKPVQLFLRSGAAHILKSRDLGPLVIYLLDTHLIPKGTEFAVETIGEDGAVVRVFDGEVELLTGDGRSITVFAGQQTTLPEGVVSPLDPNAYRSGVVSGVALRDIPLDDSGPEPYGVSVARFHPPLDPFTPAMRQAIGVVDAVAYGRPVLQDMIESAEARFGEHVGPGLPPGWIWQEVNRSYANYPPGQAPADATWEVPEVGTLRVTVPNENDFWGARDDAPRLLHKVTGDFDLEAEVLLECAGTNFAISEFLAFAPGSSPGYLAGQFYIEGTKSQYLVLGGGWYRQQNLNRVIQLNRPLADGVDPGDQPIRVRLSRRGDVMKTFWSTDDGQSWVLSSRQVVSLPETMWAGFLFKRMAQDGLPSEPAITTLRDVRLATAPLGGMLDRWWDVVPGSGEVLAGDVDLLMQQDGATPGFVQAYSPWTIEGDFDLIVRYEAAPIQPEPGQQRTIHVAVTSNDGKNHAYIQQLLAADKHAYSVDMAVDGAWFRWREAPTEDHSGSVRLMRQDGLLSAYYLQGEEWIRLDAWNDGFSGPVYLDLRYDWTSPEPMETGVRFTVESLITPEGVWFGPVDEPAE